ncbi:coiled-coil domain-containing protein [Litchfieldia alkalitelluris]|uniref:hypothetical protein n=1 Tax=Litchfieldia alkalitelluris TaxID=304268 RepID=UPI000998B712|nr:hypothetical protein [Litchfieldia alkalitelluris]
MAPGKKKQVKRYRYVDVEGIDHTYLDACLLLHLDVEFICHAISDEKSVIAKSNLNMKQIVSKDVDRLELIREISPWVRESYTLYNYLARVNMSAIERVIEIIDEDGKLTDDEIKELLKEEVLEDNVSYYYYVTWLRFKNQYHSEIKETLEYFGQKFQQETGLLLGGEFEVREVKEEEEEERIEDGIEGTFDSIVNELLALKEKVGQETYKDQFREVNEAKKQLELKLSQLQTDLNQVNEQLHAKEQQLTAKNKEQSQLKKKYDNEKKSIEQKNKEIGKLGSELGDLRKEVTDLRKENTQLLKEVTSSRNNKEEAIHALEETLQNKFRAEKSILADDYQKQINDLINTNSRLKSAMEDYTQQQSLLSDLEDENTRLSKQLEIHLKYAKQSEEQHEKEINKLKEQMKALSMKTPTEAVQVQPTQPDSQQVDEFDEFEDFLDSIGKNEPKPV